MKVGPVLTPEDINPLVAAGKLSKTDTIGWRDITYTQLSIARHYGGTNVNGVHYTYIPESDELVRDDVLKMVMKARADALKKPAKKVDKQPDMLSAKNDAKPRNSRQKVQKRTGQTSGRKSGNPARAKCPDCKGKVTGHFDCRHLCGGSGWIPPKPIKVKP